MAGNSPVKPGYRRAAEVLVAPPLNLTQAARGPPATADDMRKMLDQARQSLLPTAFGQNAQRPPGLSQQPTRFEDFDADGDGVISRAEWEAAQAAMRRT